MCSSDVSWAELSARAPWIVRCRSGSVWGLGFLGGAVLPGIEFESPIPPKKGGQKTERVIYTVPSGPPSSFKLVPIPSNSFQTVRGHLRARRAVSSDRLPLIPSLQNLHFAFLKARLCRLGTGLEPFGIGWKWLCRNIRSAPLTYSADPIKQACS